MTLIGQRYPTRLEKLNKFGYWTEENMFSDEHLERLRAAAARLQKEGYSEYRHAAQDYYPNIIEFDDAFAEILDNPMLLEGLDEVIGADVQMYANEILVSKPTGEASSWHRDKMSIGRHCPNMFLKCCIYLDDIPIDGGPTGVVPESHFDADKNEKFFPYKVDYLAKPGSMLAFGANTMHRAGLHAHGRPERAALFFVFIPWWIKQASYYTGNKCQHLIEGASPMRLQLLGVSPRPDVSMDSFSLP